MNWPIFFLALLQMEGGPPDNPYQIKEIFVDEANRLVQYIQGRPIQFSLEDRADKKTAEDMIGFVLDCNAHNFKSTTDYYRCFRFGPTGMKHPKNINHPDIKRFENLYESLLKEGK